MGTLKDFFIELGSEVVHGLAGAGYVQHWRDQRPIAAQRGIDAVVQQAFQTQNFKILRATLDSFATEIRDADSAETQNHLNELLLYFKGRVAAALYLNSA